MLYLIAFLLLEPVKRVLSFVLYPVAYHWRDNLRNCHAVVWPGYLYQPNRCLHVFLLWLFLDDSVKFTYGTENSPEDFKYPAWILAKKSDAWRSWWWAAVRNSCVNWNNWCAWKLGKLVSEPEHAGKSFYITRTFENGKRPYTEFYIFGRYNQAGWLSGTSPRFEIELMKKKGA